MTVFTKRITNKYVRDFKNINIPLEWTFNDASILCVTDLEATCIHGNLQQDEIFTVSYTLETENKSYIILQ